MSQASPFVPTTRPNTDAPVFSQVLRMLLVAGVVLTAGGVATTALWLNRLEAAAPPGFVPAPAALAVIATATTTAGDTSVPDASAVFSRERPEPEPEPEAPAPTF